MANSYKGLSVENGQVYEGKTLVKTVNGKITIDGERLTVWELAERIANPPKKQRKEVLIHQQPTINTSPKNAVQSIDTINSLKEVLIHRNAKISQSLLLNHPRAKRCAVHGIEYKSANQAAKSIHVTQKTITDWIKTGRNEAKYL